MELHRTVAYERSLRRLGATADELAALEGRILANPRIGDVVPGLKGIRKVRFSMAGKGRSGGGRALYLIVRESAIFMMVAFSKSDQNDLDQRQRKVLLAMARELEKL